MKFLLSFSILILFNSCTSTRNVKSDHLIAGSCESKFQEVELGEGEVLWQKMSEGTGTGLSYLVTGLAYSTDIAVSFTGGVIAGITVCSPFIALEGMAKSQSHVSMECVGKIGAQAYNAINPELGPKAYEGTTGWRCPDLDSIAWGLVSVSDCYRQEGDDKRADKQLQEIVESKVFQECLSPVTMNKIKKKFR